MYHVYILFSKDANRYYIGSTVLDPIERLQRHLDKYYKNKYTSVANDWIIFWTLSCCSREQAVNIEKHIKKMKSKIFIKNLIKFPEIEEKLLIKYLKNS